MLDLGWREAIVHVLQASDEPMHYTDIADAIAENNLRLSMGPTPAKSVSATISISRKNDGEESPFIRVGRGFYTLKTSDHTFTEEEESEDLETRKETGVINAFGIHWQREKVLWKSTPRILGQQQPGSDPVDFSNQNGVYLLHDHRETVYVGRTTDQPLGTRLRQHTTDRLNGRWDRFSWFGVYAVNEYGSLCLDRATAFTIDTLIVTMEALLIETLEPPQNRRRGDEFRAVEFLQVEDTEIQKSQIISLIDELKRKL